MAGGVAYAVRQGVSAVDMRDNFSYLEFYYFVSTPCKSNVTCNVTLNFKLKHRLVNHIRSPTTSHLKPALLYPYIATSKIERVVGDIVCSVL